MGSALTTVTAHFEHLPPESERRDAPRRELKLGVTGAGEPVTIRNISITGMLLESSTPLLVGATFAADLPNAGSVAAEVVWNGGNFYGCEFDRPISPAAVSAALLLSGSRPGAEPPATCNPLAELRDLNVEVERISSRLSRVIEELKHG